MNTPVRNWEEWERRERTAFYKAKIAQAQGPATAEEIARWVEEANAHIERERARLLAQEREG